MGSLFARLTAVIDALSQKGFNRAVEEDILVPLGMNDTALGTGDPNKAGVIARMARPYRLDADLKIIESNTFTPPLDYISAASGMISTVTDLARYDVAIDDDQVYSPQAKQQIWTAPRSPTGERFPYGLGWFVWEPFTKFYWHYGWYADAFSSLLFKVRDQQLTLILLACTDRASSVFSLGHGDPLRSPFVTAFSIRSAAGDSSVAIRASGTGASVHGPHAKCHDVRSAAIRDGTRAVRCWGSSRNGVCFWRRVSRGKPSDDS